MTASCFGQKNITDFIERIPLGKSYSGDLGPADTIVDIKNGYMEIIAACDVKIVLLQMAMFNNADSTVTIAVTGLFLDSQCGFHYSSFYEYSNKTDSIKKVAPEKVLPEIDINMLLEKSETLSIISPYLNEIKEKYLGKDATTAMVLSAIYSLHYKLGSRGGRMKVTLDVCDYIPMNEVPMKDSDWKIIRTDFTSLNMKYDKNKKSFVLLP